MPTFTPAWTTGLTLHTSSVITNGSSVQDDFNIATLGYYALDCQIDIDIASGSPAGNVTVEVFHSADGGTNVDTVPRVPLFFAFTGTGNKKDSFTIELRAWARVKVTNNTGVSCTYVGRYGGVKQVSA